MGKKILLLTDFSENSWRAIKYAVRLYIDQSCDFYILNTYAKDSFGLDAYVLLDPDDAFGRLSESHSRDELGNIVDCLSKEHKNPIHRFHVISRSELFLDAVKSVIDSLNIDLIVMGAKGMSNEFVKYGKNTLKVIENIRNRPVLVVPENVLVDLPKEIILATNFNSEIEVSQLKHLVEIAKINNAHIQILSAANVSEMTPAQKKNKMLLELQLNGIEYDFTVFLNIGIFKALSRFTKARRSSIISYLDKKPCILQSLGLKKTFLGKLGYNSNLPILALHQ